MNSELGTEKLYTVLHPADVELAETSTDLLEKIKKLRPRRLVLDSLSELRMVARDPLRYRRQILALKQALSELGCTVLFLDDQTSETRGRPFAPEHCPWSHSAHRRGDLTRCIAPSD